MPMPYPAQYSLKLVESVGMLVVRRRSRNSSLKDSAVTAVISQLAIGVASCFGAYLDTSIVYCLIKTNKQIVIKNRKEIRLQ